MSDKILRAIARNAGIQISAASTTGIVERAREIHNTTPLATAALGRTLTITSIMGSQLKVEDGSVTVQIKGNGPLGAIVCVGESLAVRDAGTTDEFVCAQVCAAFAGLDDIDAKDAVVAYEPIWAIGTGLTATPEEAEEVCQHIRTVIRKMSAAKTARATSILYGGSMNDENAEKLLAQPDIDGGLIGGASLDPEKFVRIINAANQETV